MTTEELAHSFSGCSNQKSGLCTSPGQQSEAGSEGMGTGEVAPKGRIAKELTLPPADGGIVLENSHWWCAEGKASGRTSSATAQAQIQGSEMARCKTSIIWEWLGCDKSQSCCSKTAGSP